MVKVSSKYNPAFVEFLKSIGGRWDAEKKVWEVPENQVAEVEAKAKELGIDDLKIIRENTSQSAPSEGAIRMRLSRDGRFVLISIDMIAFAEDVKALMEGKRKTVRFRVLPPRSS